MARPGIPPSDRVFQSWRSRAMTLVVIVGALAVLWPPTRDSVEFHLLGRATVGYRIGQYANVARARLAPFFEQAGIAYPPPGFALLAFKDEKRIDLYADGPSGSPAYVRSYRILAASGKLGPKLREGDRQVPEGVYAIEALNPNSAYHLSLRLDYPNAADQVRAARDGRAALGGDIMIHGSNASVGCLAMGDQAAEDLFVLAADAGRANVKVVLAPVDLRVRELPQALASIADWTPDLYGELNNELRRYPLAEILVTPDDHRESP